MITKTLLVCTLISYLVVCSVLALIAILGEKKAKKVKKAKRLPSRIYLRIFVSYLLIVILVWILYALRLLPNMFK